MTVAELIALLQQQPQDNDVLVPAMFDGLSTEIQVQTFGALTTIDGGDA